MQLENLTVIVTGAGSGIGKATALAVAGEGAKTVCADIVASDKTASEITERGGIAVAHTLDVRDAVGWAQLVSSTSAQFGAIDVLANVAGVVSTGPDNVLDQDEEGWQRVIDVDLKGTWLGMRAVFPGMIERGGGRIVNVASLAALVGIPNLLAYSAAKGGVVSMSRQAAIEYAAHKILINVVAPGIIETPILGDITDELRAYCSAATPLGRLGRPEDIAAMILHLAGPGGAFVTGHVFPVDGGWAAQ